MAEKFGKGHGAPFTVLVGHFPYGSDPSHNQPVFQNPPPLRQGITHQVLSVGDRRVNAQNHVGLMDGALSPKVATLTVANNDFTTGAAVITLGQYTLTSFIDFVPAGSTALTAAALAAAISLLHGFTATDNGSDVEIEYTFGPANTVDFSVIHHGTIENFTPLVPDTGVMDNGGPNFDAVDLI
jgi:hypothetical protein